MVSGFLGRVDLRVGGDERFAVAQRGRLAIGFDQKLDLFHVARRLASFPSRAYETACHVPESSRRPSSISASLTLCLSRLKL